MIYDRKCQSDRSEKSVKSLKSGYMRPIFWFYSPVLVVVWGGGVAKLKR